MESLTRFDYAVSVEAHTQEQADQVMAERLEHDEDYGFEYVVYAQGRPYNAEAFSSWAEARQT